MEFPSVGPITAEGLTIINANGVTVASVDTNGNAVFQSVNTPSIELDGFDLESTIKALPQGALTVTLLPNNSAAWSGSPVNFGQVIIPKVDSSRQYEIGFAGRFDAGTGGGTTGFPQYFLINVYYKYGSVPGTSDPILFSGQYGGRDPAVGTDEISPQIFSFQTDPTKDGQDLYLSYYMTTNAGCTSGPSYQGTSFGRIWVNDVGSAASVNTWTPGSSPVQSYTKTYSTNGTHVFEGDGTNRDAYASGHIFQGYYSSTNGNQFSIINFDYATIASDLSGATITKTEVFLTNQHWYANAGGTAIIGYASAAAGSGNYSYGNVTADVNSSSGWAVGAAKWVTVNNSIGNAFKNSNAHALALGKGPSNSTTYYGYFAGNGQTGEPQLRITYTK